MIEKKIVFAFGELNDQPLPAEFEKNLNDFKRLHPGWKVDLLSVDDGPEEFKEVFHYSKILWAQLIRFYHVYEYGGFYADLDIDFFKPLPCPGDSDLVIAIELHKSATDAFFGATPKHPVIKTVLDRVKKWSFGKLRRKETLRSIGVLDKASVGVFTNTILEMTSLDLTYDKQVHMSEKEFGGVLHPEQGVGILPFEALCRHSKDNWFGHHRCFGTWRPKEADGTVDMAEDSFLPVNTFARTSQFGQDEFAWRLLGQISEGTFLDIGAGFPVQWSNSCALERLGWSGRCIDRQGDVGAWNAERKTPLTVADATQIDYGALIEGLPPVIDYLSLDVDDATTAALERLLDTVQNHRFRVITIEHDRYRLGDGPRDQQRRLLMGAGYQLVGADMFPNLKHQGIVWEDWYVDPGLVDIGVCSTFFGMRNVNRILEVLRKQQRV